MNILTIILIICAIGLVLYLVNNYLPLDAKIKTILNWVVVIFLILWLLKVFGVWQYLSSINV